MPLLPFSLGSLVSGSLAADLQTEAYKIIIWDIIFKYTKFGSYIMGKILVKCGVNINNFLSYRKMVL